MNEFIDDSMPPEGSEIPELEKDPELAQLLGELEGLGFSERASFGPELLGQLERAWLKEAVIPATRRVWPRAVALVAGLAAVALTSVPPARAALQAFILRATPVERTQNVPPPSTRFLPLPTVVDQDLSVPDETPVQLPEPGPPVVDLNDDEPFIPARVTYPELRDPEGAEALIRSFYPAALRSAGIGGVTRVALWVDVDGNASEPRIAESSGEPRLDQAAAAAAPNLRFYPALERGIPRGTWVEFEVNFSASVVGTEPASAPASRLRPVPEPFEEPDLVVLGSATVGLATEAEANRATFRSGEAVAVDGAELLREAMDPSEPGVAALGSARSILHGEAPASVLPLNWRAEAAQALEAAILRSPGNPAPYLALGRIRTKQGLGSDALRLFNLGLARVKTSDRAIPPNVVAGLHYERGILVRGRWAPWADLGQVPVAAMPREACQRAGDTESVGGRVGSQTVIRWNYLCPEALERVLVESFEPLSGSGDVYRTAFLEELAAAVDANPAHREAAMQLILQLADEGRWDEALDRAQTLAIASGETPESLLLLGLTEHRSGNSARADEVFRRALAGIEEDQARALKDPTRVMSSLEVRRLEAASPEERRSLEARFWSMADPLPGTTINEAWVEHLSRGTYAHFRFGTGSEVAEAWVRYGRPANVRAFGAGETRLVLWDLGPGPDLSLRRSASSFDLSLSSEGAAFLDELREVEPRRWPLPVSTEALSGQASRFRGDEPGSSHIRLAVDVSQLVEAGDASVDFELLQLDADGSKKSLGRFTRFGAAEVLRTGATVTPEAGEIVLEIDRGMGNKAVFRAPVEGSAGSGSAVADREYASDLMLVEPVRPVAGRASGARTEWSAESVLPLASPVVETGQGLGLYVEFYGLPDADVELQAILRSSDGTRVVPLLVRPGGVGEAQVTWAGTHRSSGVLREFVVADLTNVPPGEYTVVAGVAGGSGGEEWSASHPVVLR